MAKIPDHIIEILKRYIFQLEKHNFHIKQAILFGSYANGSYDKWSDIDIALVSDNFEGVRFLDRAKIARITLDVDYNISPLTYKSEDFTEENLFIKEIIETGFQVV